MDASQAILGCKMVDHIAETELSHHMGLETVLSLHMAMADSSESGRDNCFLTIGSTLGSRQAPTMQGWSSRYSTL